MILPDMPVRIGIVRQKQAYQAIEAVIIWLDIAIAGYADAAL